MKTEIQFAKQSTVILFFVFLLVGCGEKNNATAPDAAATVHANEKNLTTLIIYDIFTPPVASRIYAYTSLAAHEAIRHAVPGEKSIAEKLKGFPEMPQPDKNKKYDFTLAASKAFYDVMRQMTFSKDTITKFEEQTYSGYRNALDKNVFAASIEFGEQVAAAVSQRLSADNYKQTRAMEKFFGSKDDGKWQPTSPDYLDGVEPYWTQIKSFVMDSSGQFDPGQPPPFSKEKGSEFYKMNQEVFDISKNLTQEQKDIASFWDDNPFVSHHTGHLMYNTKKQTPGGHWMGIAAIACRKNKLDQVKTARVYALTAIALFEGFISVFDTKYRYVYVRPITILNQWMDPKWEPFLQTPPFPEYTSGHSTISGSVAAVLTGLFGDNFAFHDDADKEYIGMERDFKSFFQAADEASISRLYGGIHYRISLDIGVATGKKVGGLVLSKLNQGAIQ